MPGVVCKVPSCTNTYTKTRKNGITFHRFPRNAYIRDMWMQKCNNNSTFNPDHSHVCSNHFRDDDFQRDLKSELLGTKSKRILKPESIPSLNLPLSQLKDVTEIVFEVIELRNNEEVCFTTSQREDLNLSVMTVQVHNEEKYRNRIYKLCKRNLALDLEIKRLWEERSLFKNKRRARLKRFKQNNWL